MKKYLVLLLCILVLLTGCEATKKEKAKPVTENKSEEVSLIEVNNDASEEATDEDVVNYVSTIENEIENINYTESKKETIKEKLKENFIILTDFIFYDGTIKGKTFNELTTSAKEEILELYEKIDNKIESIYPNYKEEIKDTSTKVYSKAKSMVISLKDYLKKSYIDSVGEDTYQKEMEIIKDTKDKVKEKTEPVIDTAKEKTKETYEKTKDKLNTWYQGIKESSE
ncbi:MAG: hypothetical protein SPJ06_00060 [Bacilli bacterium]|nr:hypothetical protein [Bacilli bacterium]